MILRITLYTLAAALVLSASLALYINASMSGRGTRPALGDKRFTFSDAASGNHKVAYYDSGEDDKTVVLLASWARSISDFNELVAALNSAGYRTLAVQSRGIDGSAFSDKQTTTVHDLAKDVEQVLRENGITAAHVIGHAFGNRVARTFAADYPEHVTSLTLIAAGGKVPIPAELTKALGITSQTYLPYSRREPSLRHAFFHDESTIPDYWKNGWWLKAGLLQSAANKATEGTEFWAGGTAPMLVVQASHDTIAPTQHAGRALAEDFPNRVTLVMIEGAGHALLPEQPGVIHHAVIAFLSQH